MRHTLFVLSLLVSGVAAAAQAQTVPSASPTVAPAAIQAQAPQHRANRFNSPLTVDQAEALLCPRWNCDAVAIDKAYRAANAQAAAQAVVAQRKAAPAADATVALAPSAPVHAGAM
jgi:hypothetical protein